VSQCRRYKGENRTEQNLLGLGSWLANRNMYHCTPYFGDSKFVVLLKTVLAFNRKTNDARMLFGQEGGQII